MAKDRVPKVVNVWTSTALTANGTITSNPIYLGDKAQEGVFAIQYYLTHASGTPTVKFEYNISIDGANYLEPSTATDIATGITKTSGPGANGKDIVSFEPELGMFMKILATESSNQAGTLTLDLIVQ